MGRTAKCLLLGWLLWSGGHAEAGRVKASPDHAIKKPPAASKKPPAASKRFGIRGRDRARGARLSIFRGRAPKELAPQIESMVRDLVGTPAQAIAAFEGIQRLALRGGERRTVRRAIAAARATWSARASETFGQGFSTLADRQQGDAHAVLAVMFADRPEVARHHAETALEHYRSGASDASYSHDEPDVADVLRLVERGERVAARHQLSLDRRSAVSHLRGALRHDTAASPKDRERALAAIRRLEK